MTTKRLFNYFLRGLLVTGPLALTVYALVMVFNMVDSIIPMREWSYQLFHVRLYGIGFLVVVAFTILMGYFSYNFLFNKLIMAMEALIGRSKLLKQVYGSIKDLIGAFAGEEKRFNKPVLVMIDKENQVQRMGFLTHDDLSDFGTKDSVAVYCPMSYSFAGIVLIVPRTSITPITGITSTEAMKFIVSGGVTKLDD
jgi:uncharacterized membrane protein